MPASVTEFDEDTAFERYILDRATRYCRCRRGRLSSNWANSTRPASL